MELDALAELLAAIARLSGFFSRAKSSKASPGAQLVKDEKWRVVEQAKHYSEQCEL